MKVSQKIAAYALGKHNPDLDRRIATDSDTLLSESIMFVPATKPVDSKADWLKDKYRVLKAPASPPPLPTSNLDFNPPPKKSKLVHQEQPSTSTAARSPEESEPVKANNDGVPLAAIDVHKAHIIMEWDKDELGCETSLGLPLHNMGNTCFLNSVLQVLTHTPALVHFLTLSHRNCSQATNGWCGLCELRTHIQAALLSRRGKGSYALNDSPIVPQRILQRMRCFMKSYMKGRQEDAHELLRYLLDSLQTACLVPFRSQRLDMFSKHTTAIAKIFGGYHRNEITCMQCQGKSTTYDPFMDVSLEVKRFNCVEDALKNFTKVEYLSQDNAYKCLKCHSKVRARKQYTIHRPPRILTIQLKRFDAFGKINAQIKYPERLNLRPYMSDSAGSNMMYRLYASIVHQGGSTHSGHYYAFVRNMGGDFHLMDDDRVSPIATRSVLNQPAYLLFYARQPTPPSVAVKPRVMPPNSSWAPVTAPAKTPVAAPALSPTISTAKPGQPVHVVEPLKQERKPVKINLHRKNPVLGVKLKAEEKEAVKPTSLVPYGGSDEDSTSSSDHGATPEKPVASASPKPVKSKSGSNSPSYNVFARLGHAEKKAPSPTVTTKQKKSGLTTPEEFLYSGLPAPAKTQVDGPRVSRSEERKVEEKPRDRSLSSGDESGKIKIKLNLHGSGNWRVAKVDEVENLVEELRVQTAERDSNSSSSETSKKKKRKKADSDDEPQKKKKKKHREDDERRKHKKKKHKHRRHSSSSPEAERRRREEEPKSHKKEEEERHQKREDPDCHKKEEESERRHEKAEGSERKKPREEERREDRHRDGGKKRKWSEEEERRPRRTSDDILNKLKQGGGLTGYAGVKSWSGGESVVEAEKRRERREEDDDHRARHHSDDEDNRYYRQKNKRYSLPTSSHNRFQRLQDNRNDGRFSNSGNFAFKNQGFALSSSSHRRFYD